MPGLVGGFGNLNYQINIIINYFFLISSFLINDSFIKNFIKLGYSNLINSVLNYVGNDSENLKINNNNMQISNYTEELRKKLGGYLAGPAFLNSPKEKLSIEKWGSNLGSTVGWGKYTNIQRTMIKLPPFQYSVIVGIMLSDGNLSFSNNKSKNARLRLKQSYAHIKYLWSTFLILSHYCNILPVIRKANWNGSVNYSIEFTTRSLPCFTELYDKFYLKGKKIIPNNIYELLTPVALAHMIMGDGLSHSSGLYLCTDSYSLQDTIRLLNVLLIRYNFNCRIREHNPGQFRIYIRKQSINDLITLVKPYLHPSFYYKLGINKLSNTTQEIARCRLNLTVNGKSVPENNARNYSTNSSEGLAIGTNLDLNSTKNFSSYLAGLLEANGTFAIHNKESKSKKYNPKIAVVFNIVDEPLAFKLLNITKAGTIYKKNNAGHILWQIQKLEDVLLIINIINGFMRTPKIEALHRAINWFNENHDYNIPCLNLDTSPIDSNSWLAGFTDGDGNFSISLINRKKNGRITSKRKRVQTFFRIELRQNYHRDVSVLQGGASYFPILNKIATFLNVNLLTRTREKENKTFYAFMVISHSLTSHVKVINYFDRYPLYSSKILAYKDWSYVVQLIKLRAGKPLTLEEISKVEKIKAQFNSKRTSFDFSHLNRLF